MAIATRRNMCSTKTSIPSDINKNFTAAQGGKEAAQIMELVSKMSIADENFEKRVLSAIKDNLLTDKEKIEIIKLYVQNFGDDENSDSFSH